MDSSTAREKGQVFTTRDRPGPGRAPDYRRPGAASRSIVSTRFRTPEVLPGRNGS